MPGRTRKALDSGEPDQERTSERLIVKRARLGVRVDARALHDEAVVSVLTRVEPVTWVASAITTTWPLIGPPTAGMGVMDKALTRSASYSTASPDDPQDALVLVETPKSLDRHPVAVYLAGLAPGSRRAQRAALRVVAMVVHSEATELTLPWGSLDFGHTSAIRSRFAERFAPATANRMLAAMRMVLKTSFKLGLMSSDQMTRACAVDPV